MNKQTKRVLLVIGGIFLLIYGMVPLIGLMQGREMKRIEVAASIFEALLGLALILQVIFTNRKTARKDS